MRLSIMKTRGSRKSEREAVMVGWLVGYLSMGECMASRQFFSNELKINQFLALPLIIVIK